MEQIISNTNSVQQGLNEVVINKVRRMIDGKAAGVEATLNRLQAEGKISQDFIAPIGVNLKMNDHSPVITFAHPQDGQVVMNMPNGQFTMHDNAIGQIADRMGIPQRYLRTSDYGDGSVDMRSFLLNGACLNGMVRESVMRQVHLGSKLPDNLALSQRTYELDTQTTVSAVRDLTQGLYSKDNLLRKAHEIQGASEMVVDLDNEVKKLTRDGWLLKAEGEAVQKILMNNNPDDGVTGAPTLWKLTQAITAHARELSPERSRELHEISGNLLNRVKLA